MIPAPPTIVIQGPLPLIPRPVVRTLNLRLRLISGSTGAADVPSIIWWVGLFLHTDFIVITNIGSKHKPLVKPNSIVYNLSLDYWCLTSAEE